MNDDKFKAWLDQGTQLWKDQEKEKEKFFKKYIIDNDKEVSLVLQTHLYLESQLNIILSFAFPKFSRIKEMRFQDKIILLEELNYNTISEKVINKIKIVNKIRNRFAHNLDYQLTDNDAYQLNEEYNPKLESPRQFFVKSIIRLKGYLDATIHANKLFPFLFSCMRNKQIFQSDRNFDYRAIIESYTKRGAITVLETMMHDTKANVEEKK